VALIVAIAIVVALYFFSPVAAGIVAILAGIFFYKSSQRTKYMTNEEVDMALRLNSIEDPNERKKIKAEIDRRINERMAADKRG